MLEHSEMVAACVDARTARNEATPYTICRDGRGGRKTIEDCEGVWVPALLHIPLVHEDDGGSTND